MPTNLLLTDAGADLFVEAGQQGTEAVTIDRIVFADGKYTHSAAQTALVGTTLRTLTTADGNLTAGGSTAGNVIHLSVQDTDTTQAYDVYEVGVFSGDTLVAVWSAGAGGDPLLTKISSTNIWLVIDIAIASGAASVVEVGDLSLDINQATTEKRGTVELATAAETETGTDPYRVITCATLKAETDKLVTKATAQSITAKKTFTVTPEAPDIASTADNSAKIPNTKWVQDLIKATLLAAHPVGSYYITEGTENPGTLFGGTWQKLQNRFLYGSGTLTAGSQGGAASVTLDVANLPSHTHTGTTGSAGSHAHDGTAQSGGAHTHTGTAASAGSHAHTGSAQSAGAHTHTVTVTVPAQDCTCQTAGKHTHTATIASNGAHTHGPGTYEITGKVSAAGLFDADQGQLYSSGALGFYETSNGKGDADKSGTNNIGLSLQADKDHGWSGATASAGSHAHTITINNEAAHGHIVTFPKTVISNGSAASGGAHTHTLSVNSNGSHTHTITASSAGAHTHTLTVESGGAHTHSFTTAARGSGTAFAILPPYRVVHLWKRTA